ncbi:MAG TPA: CBS domain-containing protein [Myxococcota bacterium]|nr:CBS domain-containing protein [Myxococcota bacterium]
MKVAQFLRREPETISARASCGEAAQRMRDTGVGSLVVIEDDRPIGIVTDRDLVLRVMAAGAEAGAVAVAEIMTDKPAFISEDRDVSLVLDTMRELGVRRIPVVDPSQRCVGVIALDDIVAALAFELGGVAEVIRAAR